MRVRREGVSHLSHFHRSHLSQAKDRIKKKRKKESTRLDLSGTAEIHQKIGKEAIERFRTAFASHNRHDRRMSGAKPTCQSMCDSPDHERPAGAAGCPCRPVRQEKGEGRNGLIPGD